MKIIKLLIGLLLIGCHSGKDLSEKWKIQLPPKSELILSGSFDNVGTQGTNHPVSLWNVLNSIPARSNNYVDSINNDSSLTVKLDLNKDSTSLIAYLVSKDSIIDSLKYNGEVINNYFFVNQSSKKFLLPPIYWYVNQSELIIGSESKDSLSLIHLSSGKGGILIFMGDGGGQHKSKYKRN
jgi:hypothetical protein